MERNTGPDLTPWYLAAAVFWFEGLGVMGLAAGVLFAPFSCFGDRFSEEPIPAGDACASGQAPFFHDGVAAIWLATLLAVAAAIGLLWLLTKGSRRMRGAVCLVLGVGALAAIAWAAASGPLAVALTVLWVGVPAALLLGSAKSLLTSPPAT